ncbi:MAG TPA: methylated-DNA--[protein]-cysteine S-methyltransferase [Flavisolibacter sp.]|nr:methylated-DNA--[protein]-cysteine S-methyltransferase [Flavisolibacter sp.]
MKTYTTYLDSPLGQLQVQCNESSLVKVHFIDEPVEAVNEEHPLLQACSDQLRKYFEGSLKRFDLPLGQQGTPFQLKVWELLYRIPFGKTLSYNELSKRYGDVKAIRAVASANGRNNLAIIVPCHRVIGSNASLTGYAGGLWRKKWLLDHEAKLHSGVMELEF